MRRVMPMVAAVVALQPAGVEPAAAPGAAELTPHPSVARAVSIDVELPARASGFVRLTDRRSGVSIRVAAVGAQSVLGERDGDALAFRGAFGDADLLLRRGPDGFE